MQVSPLSFKLITLAASEKIIKQGPRPRKGPINQVVEEMGRRPQGQVC